jgi:hypothetical protein
MATGYARVLRPNLTSRSPAVGSAVQALVRIAAAMALVLSLGLHWALLQTVAWTGMVVSYSRQGTVQQAIAKTFDGKHPCCLCNAIKKGRAEEQKQKPKQSSPDSKLDVALLWQAVEFDFRSGREPIFFTDATAPARSDEPPKPRPRGASLTCFA